MSSADARTLRGGRYVLGPVLGDGGMATVYRAHDNELEVDIAIKLLHAEEGRTRASMVRRLRLEAKAMARLRHPNVLRMSDVFEEGDDAYVVMDLAEGGSLNAVLDEQGPMPPNMAIHFTLQILSALAAAHAEGIVHRDVKPHNVLLDARGTALLADFGIALVSGRDRRTKQGVTMGSVAFMPPEQRLDAASVGPAADIHATGATLYNLLTGENPVDLFLAEDDSDRWEGVPEVLRPVIATACHVTPAARYADAGAMAEALTSAMDEAGWGAWVPPTTLAGTPFPAPSTAFTRPTAGSSQATWKLPSDSDGRISTAFADPFTGASRADSLTGDLELRPPTVLRPEDARHPVVGGTPPPPELVLMEPEDPPQRRDHPVRLAVAAVLFAALGAAVVFGGALGVSWWRADAPVPAVVDVAEPAAPSQPQVVAPPAADVGAPPEPEPEPEPEPAAPAAVAPAPAPAPAPEVAPAPGPVAVAPRPAPVAAPSPEPVVARALRAPTSVGAGQPYHGVWSGTLGGRTLSAVFDGAPDAVQGEVLMTWGANQNLADVRGTWDAGKLVVQNATHAFTLEEKNGRLEGRVKLGGRVGGNVVVLTRVR